jgi:hypothetical protein
MLPGDPSRRLRTLEAGDAVDVLDGTRWLRVSVDGVAGLVPAGAVEVVESGPESEPEPEPAPAGGGIRPFEAGRCFVGEPILAHVDFHPALRRLDTYAARVGARIHVTHSFRPPDAVLEGTVAPPARRSNHLVGHAIDMNVVLPGHWLNSKRLRRERLRELPAEARYLIQQIRDDDELRWGGDFVRPDPVHIDDDLSRRDPEQWLRKLRAV